MFTVNSQTIDPQQLAAELATPEAGANVVFEGIVRDHHGGRQVLGLTYEAFPEMAIRTGTAILEEARQRFSIHAARAEHRVGQLNIGDRAVWVGVSSSHRQEAFLACRWIMDRIKAEVPVWKKEAYADGERDWVSAGEGSRFDSLTDPATDPRYARQVCLPEVGPEGQRQLAESHVLVIGAGGLGCPAMLYLAAAGIGSLTLCDGDRLEASNLHRQVLFQDSDIGQNKATAAAERLRAFHPGLSFDAVPEAADAANLPRLLKGKHLVLDCTDNFEAKYAIHDAAYQAGVPLIQAAVYQFDGWVQQIKPGVEAGCYRCLWPEPPPVGCVGNCAQAGVLGVTPGLLGIYQAIEALKALLDLPGQLTDATLYVNVLNGQTRRIKRPLRDSCPCRGTTPWPKARLDLLSPGNRAEEILRTATIVDLREAEERMGNPEWIQKLTNVPRAEWNSIPERFKEQPVVLCCAVGKRSRECLEQLGRPRGFYAWTCPIDSLMENSPKEA